ncbi:MAG TPA: ABC transporter permease [Candidatus Limnocylindria bacterium]|nr:ABC transporter permease [Candidatus Limnocylindria bacterium]
MNLGRLRAIVWKEFIQMRRDRATLGMMLGVPVMQLLLFGYAIRQEVRNLPTIVYDASRSQQSRALVQRFEATGNFRMRGQAFSYADAIEAIDAGRARAAIVVPEDFARRVKRGRPAQVQVLVDATDPTASQAAIGAAQMVGQAENVEHMLSRIGAPRGAGLPMDVRVRPLYNPALKSALFIVPGIIGMILSNILILVTAMSIVREREHGTLEQLIVTPLSPSEIMLGKIAPYVVVGLVQITAVLIVGHLLFGVPVRGNLLLVYGVSLLFIVANLGLGLFISTLAKAQAPAMQASFFFLLPNVLLSGFMFPREAMPPLARDIGYALPLTHYLQVIRGIVLKGVGLQELWPQCLALVGFAILYFTFSALRFHKQLE